MNKKLIIILSVWLASIFLTGFVVYGITITSVSNPTFEAGTQIETAHYMLWIEGSTYYAKNGLTGTVASSSNASYLLQTCIDALVDAGTAYAYGMIELNARIMFLSNLALDSPIDLTNITNLELVGVGKDQGVELKVQHSGAMAFDFTNSRFLSIRNLAFDVDSGYTPQTVIYMARGTAAASIGDSVFENCDFDDNGGVTVAFIYNYGGELITFRECGFRNNGTMIDINRDNWAQVNSTFMTELTGTASISMISFRDCNFYCDAATTEPIKLNAGVINVLFDHCYFGGTVTDYAFYLNCTNGAVHKLTVKHCHFEKLGFTSVATAVNRDIEAFTFVDNTIYLTNAQVFFDFNKTNLFFREARIEGNYQSHASGIVHMEVNTADYCHIDFRSSLNSFTLNATNNIRYSRIVVRDSDHITCTGGYVAVNGTYFSNGASFP